MLEHRSKVGSRCRKHVCRDAQRVGPQKPMMSGTKPEKKFVKKKKRPIKHSTEDAEENKRAPRNPGEAKKGANTRGQIPKQGGSPDKKQRFDRPRNQAFSAKNRCAFGHVPQTRQPAVWSKGVDEDGECRGRIDRPPEKKKKKKKHHTTCLPALSAQKKQQSRPIGLRQGHLAEKNSKKNVDDAEHGREDVSRMIKKGAGFWSQKDACVRKTHWRPSENSRGRLVNRPGAGRGAKGSSAMAIPHWGARSPAKAAKAMQKNPQRGHGEGVEEGVDAHHTAQAQRNPQRAATYRTPRPGHPGETRDSGDDQKNRDAQ